LVEVQGDYVNATGGDQAYGSNLTANAVGAVAMTVDKEWLQGKSSNNITLFLFAISAALGDNNRAQGPTLMVTNRPADYYRQEPAKAPGKKELYIALPIVFAFIIICVIGGYFWNRKTRKIGLGNVMGRKGGYGSRKSKAQRMGLGKKNKAAEIQLREQELTADGQFKDMGPPKIHIQGHTRGDSDALGSLAGSPTKEGTNYFREEIKRQGKEQNRF
jgi:hypothetical protein